jgi:L-asparaginase
MKTKKFHLRSILTSLFLILSIIVLGQEKKLPNIVILATGGTIAGAGASATGSAYTSGQVKIDAMIDAVPNIRNLANLKGEQVANVGS